jgi:hypothetical protein
MKIENKSQPQFVLYINAWGIGSKMMQGGSEIFKPVDLLTFQKHFVETLDTLSRGSNLEVRRAGDLAYVYSEKIGHLVELASRLFQETLIYKDSFVLWPLRAALACDVESFEPTPSSIATYIGKGNVEAAWLEKSAQKGMRLFATESTSEAIEKYLRTNSTNLNFLTRPSFARGIKHQEINWLNSTYLERKTGNATIESHFQNRCRELMRIEDDYSRQFSASLTDLVSWLRKT